METINQILDVFNNYRMRPTPEDVYDILGKPKLYEKIAMYVALNLPIPFVMLGFPFKSTNSRDKVLGTLPDQAEKLTLENFAEFDNDIRAVYQPGVEISIISDGFVFNDILGVSDRMVEEYKEISMDMGRIAPMKWFDLKDFYGYSLEQCRIKVIEHFGITPEKLTTDILTNININYLYRGIVLFMSQELVTKTWDSGNQLQKAAKKLAREMMFRNEAYSNLVKKEFPNHIRLSMHPSINDGTKYSFKLLKSDPMYSAWHSAALQKGDEWTTIHKKDAVAANYELVYENNRPFYFKTP